MSQGFKIKMQKPKDGTYSLGQLIHVKMKAKGWTVDEFAAQIASILLEQVSHTAEKGMVRGFMI